MRKAFAESLREWLAKLPDVSPVGICPNDGYGWCECKACRALDTEEDRKSSVQMLRDMGVTRLDLFDYVIRN